MTETNDIAELKSALARIENKLDFLGQRTGEHLGSTANLINAVLEVALQNQGHLKLISAHLAEQQAAAAGWDGAKFDEALAIRSGD